MTRYRPKRQPHEAAIGRPVKWDPAEVRSAMMAPHRELAEKLGTLPGDLGVSLISLGLIGAVIPGPVPLGASFIVLGTVVLCPGLLARMGGPLAKRCPRVVRVLIDFSDHLRADLARRYPGSLSE